MGLEPPRQLLRSRRSCPLQLCSSGGKGSELHAEILSELRGAPRITAFNSQSALALWSRLVLAKDRLSLKRRRPLMLPRSRGRCTASGRMAKRHLLVCSRGAGRWRSWELAGGVLSVTCRPDRGRSRKCREPHAKSNRGLSFALAGPRASSASSLARRAGHSRVLNLRSCTSLWRSWMPEELAAALHCNAVCRRL